MSLRWSALLLAAASAFAAEYKASDDVRVVYFTGTPVGDPVPSRLWRWGNGAVETLVDTYSPNLNPTHVRILRLSTNGRLALISLSRLTHFQPDHRWQIRLDGAPQPLIEITDAEYVSLSPNARWLAVFRRQPGRAVELFELSETSLRSIAIWPDPRLDGLPEVIADYPSLVSDDAQVRVPCPGDRTPCVWNTRTGTTQPQSIPFDGTARTFYQWHFNPRHRGQSLYNAAGGERGVNCFDSFFAIPATDPTGRRAHLVCGVQHLLYNADTGATTPLPPEPTLNSTLTAILTRPTPTRFLWQPLGGPTPEPINRFDTIPLLSATSPTGLFATSQPPDFTLEWGGQSLPWVEGSLGYHYAFLPADIVPGAIDSFRLTFLTRPWLNVQRDRTVARDALAALPINAADPRFLLIHEDYSGLITPDAPARPGERIHLYVTGIDPAEFTQESTAIIAQPNNPNLAVQQPGIVLRGVSLEPTAYSRSLQLLTLEVPQNMAFYSAPTQTPILMLQLRKKAGDEVIAAGPVWFSIRPN